MASENKITPNSNISRQAALVSGDAKNTAMGAASVLKIATQDLLVAIVLLYNNAMDAITGAKAIYLNGVITKDKKEAACEMVCSHFIQVFVFGVARGVFSVGDLAYYGLPESGTLPDMRTEAKLLAVAKRLITGDVERMLVPGAVAMAMPSINDVKHAKIDFDAARTDVNNASETLKDLQIACNDLNPQADKTIKFMWGEIETSYSDLPRETMRAKAKLWGMIFEKVGGTKIITGKVTDSVTELGIEGVEIFFENGNNVAISDADGNFTLDTTLMEVQKLMADHPLYEPWSEDVTLVENENQIVNIVMVKIV